MSDLSVFHSTIKDKLNSVLHQDINRDVIIYAISINEIECWLIPFISTDIREYCNNDRCLNIVNRHIRTKGTIDKDNKNSPGAQALYDNILNNKKKSKDFIKIEVKINNIMSEMMGSVFKDYEVKNITFKTIIGSIFTDHNNIFHMSLHIAVIS